MKRLFFLSACMTVVVALLGACTASRLDMDYGTSYKLAKISQVLNPEAEENLEPVYGLNGIVSQSVMDNYYAGFKEKRTAPTYAISIGDIKTGP